jgi:hypothetical protein
MPTKPLAGTLVNPYEPLARGLYAAWPLADGCGPARDHAGFGPGNPLNFIGATPPTWTAGPDGPAVSFPGASGGRLQSANAIFDPSAGDFSAAIWFVANSWGTGPVLLGTSGAVNWITVSTSGAIKAVYGATLTSGNGKVTIGAWHHAAMTLQGTTLTLYLDGTQVAQGTSTRPAAANASLFVGGNSTAGALLNGTVGGVVLRQRALAAAEVLLDYTDPYRIYRHRRKLGLDRVPAAVIGPGILMYHRRRRTG